MFLLKAKKRPIFGLVFFYFLSTNAWALSQNQIEILQKKAIVLNMAHQGAWLKLFDYKKTLFNNYKSQIVNDDFFLSASGKTSPQDELVANIAQIFSDKSINDKHARCLFPARAYYLASEFHLKLASEDLCPEFSKFKSSFRAESVSLIFSSYYVNNPSSTFGHTFLKFNQHRQFKDQDTDLTDLSVNFGANPWSKNPIIYSIGGITGWFSGTYSTLPYYYKVREYNNFDSRDLWSYQLKLTRQEIDQLVRHLWELGRAKYNYYFFTQNCSYHILTAVEAAAPHYQMIEHLPYWVIPSDTILETQKEGAISEISYRPSARNIFINHLNKLSDQERKEFYRLRNLKTLVSLKTNNKISQSQIIDVLLDWINYKYFVQIKNKNSPEFKWQNELLEKRASLPMTQELQVPTPKTQPQLSHPSARIAISAGRNNYLKQDFQRYHLRFALHDLLDPEGGYPENIQVEFFNLIFQTRSNFHKFSLNQFDLVDVININPLQGFEKNLSWKFDLGARTMQKKDCNYCQAVFPNAGVGVAIDILKKTTIYTFLQGGPLYSNNFNDDKKFHFKVGPEIGVLLKPIKNLKGIINYDRYYDLVAHNQIYKTTFTLRKSFGNLMSLGANSTMENGTNEFFLNLFYYF